MLEPTHRFAAQPVRYGFVALHGIALASLLVIASCGGGGNSAAVSSPGATVPAAPSNPTTPPPAPTPVGSAQAFGAQTHFAQNWNIDLVPRLKAAGLTEVRDELYWQVVEPAAGKFQFPASYDRYMAALRDAGITPLIELTFENKNYDDGNTPHTDAGFAAYARYATEVLKRYGSQINAVEIWNEYNGTFAKGPATADRAGTYTKMLRVAYQAIKRERPDVTVVGGATIGVPMPYLERLFQAGALDAMDVLSVHPYRSNIPPEGIEAQIVALRQLVARYNHGRQKPIWVTEIGWGTRNTGTPGDLVIDETMQANFLVRAYALLFAGGVERVYWYLFRDYMDFETMGLVNNDPGYSAKPAHLAMKTMIAHLGDATFVAREKTDAHVYSMHFRRASGEDVRVMWALQPTNFTPGAAARVVDLSGNTRSSAGVLRLDDSPVFVSGPLTILPSPSATNLTFLTDASGGFSSKQGEHGWSYGAFVGDSIDFQPLTFRTTDWKEEWGGAWPYLSLTASDQHPSGTGGKPVAAVRRWLSDFSGRVRVEAQFRARSGGDGVRVRVLVDGQVRHHAALGGGQSITAAFGFEEVVQPGTKIDFVVDPGAAANLENDATAVSVTLHRLN